MTRTESPAAEELTNRLSDELRPLLAALRFVSQAAPALARCYAAADLLPEDGGARQWLREHLGTMPDALVLGGRDSSSAIVADLAWLALGAADRIAEGGVAAQV